MKEIILALGVISGGFFGVMNFINSDIEPITKEEAVSYFEDQTMEEDIVINIEKYKSTSGYKGFRVTLKEGKNILGMGTYDSWILTTGTPDNPVRISPVN